MQLFQSRTAFHMTLLQTRPSFLVQLIHPWMPVVRNDVLELLHFINWSSLQLGIISTSQTDVHKINFSPLVTWNYYQYQDEQFCLQFPSECCNQTAMLQWPIHPQIISRSSDSCVFTALSFKQSCLFLLLLCNLLQ